MGNLKGFCKDNSGARMGRRVDIPQAFTVHAGVNLRRRERCMAQQGLYRPQVCALSQKMRCKGMA